MQDFACRKALEQSFAGRAVSDMTARQHEGEWTTLSIRQRVDLRRATAARAADRLIGLPPFPPEAERCALTAELSMRTCAGGPPA